MASIFALDEENKGTRSESPITTTNHDDRSREQKMSKDYRRFVPSLALKHIEDQMIAKGKETFLKEPYFVKKHWSVMLFMDISGFTRLSQMLGAEKTKKHCNIYFTRILNVIGTHFGDVYKFLGDAVMVIWPLKCNSSDTQKMHACTVAVECAKQVMRVGNYDAQDKDVDTDEAVSVSLRLHCGIACGPMLFYNLGNKDRMDNLIGGPLLPQLAECEGEAEKGQIVMSPEVVENLNMERHRDEIERSHSGQNFLLHWDESSKPPQSCTSSLCRLIGGGSGNTSIVSPLSSQKSETKNHHHHQNSKGPKFMQDLFLTKAFLDCSICIKEVVKQNSDLSKAEPPQSIRASVHEMAIKAIDDDMLEYMGEMRKVTTVFVRLDDLIPAISNGNVKRVNTVQSICYESVQKGGGIVRQFVQDDKGCVLIGAFGPQGHSYIDNEARALRCALSLIETLEKETKIKCSIGIATGDVYCGLVGGNMRSEWAMLGPSVNLAARLMGKAPRGACLVENEVCRSTLLQTKEFWFRRLEDVNAKGYTNPVPVFEPKLEKKHPSPLRKTHSVMIGNEHELMSSRKNGNGGIDTLQMTLQKVNDLSEFESLVLKVCSVIACDLYDIHREKHVNLGFEEESFSKWHNLGMEINNKDIQSDNEIKSRTHASREIITVGAISFVVAALGYPPTQQLQKALLKLQCDPPLLQFASQQKPFRKQSTINYGNSTRLTMSMMKSQKALAQAMSRHYLFESMSKDRLRHIAAKFKAINLKAQESVFQIGDNSNGMFYILEKGTLEVKFPGGRCTKLKPGQCFGDVALLYQCERCMTVQAGNEECVIWSLTSEEFYKVKKLRYVFKYRSIQKAVYRRILKGHRKTLHSLVASYMIDQKKRREKLRSRFGKKTNALKAALLWSIQTKHNVPIPAEEDSVMTIKDAQKEREKRNSNLKIHHGMSFAEGSDKAKCPNLALAMVMKRATNKFARGKNKRSSRRFSDYLAVLRDEIRNLEDAPRDKEDQEIAELRKEKYSALALTHAGDITEHMETVSTVHSSLAESTIAFSKSMDTQKQSNGGLFGGNLGEIQEGADGSDEDGGGFDEEDNDDDDNFEDNFEALRNMVMERKSKVQTDGTLVHVNESFQNGAGLTERMCSHLLMSRIRSAITLGQVHKAAIAASEVRDHSMALKWYNEMIAKMLHVESMPIVLRHFVKFENSKINSFRSGHANKESKSLSDRVWRHRWTLHEITTTRLADDQIRVLNVLTQIKQQLCDAERMRKRAMMLHKTSQRGIVVQTDSTITGDDTNTSVTEPQILDRNKKLTLNEWNKNKSSNIMVSRVLRRMADIYAKIGEKNLAFNAAQIALRYLDLPGAVIEKYSFSRMLGFSKSHAEIKLEEFKTWYGQCKRVDEDLARDTLLGGLSLYDFLISFLEESDPMWAVTRYASFLISLDSNISHRFKSKLPDV